MRHALRANDILTLFFVSMSSLSNKSLTLSHSPRVHQIHTRNRSALARASAGTSETCVCMHQLDAEEVPSGPD